MVANHTSAKIQYYGIWNYTENERKRKNSQNDGITNRNIKIAESQVCLVVNAGAVSDQWGECVCACPQLRNLGQRTAYIFFFFSSPLDCCLLLATTCQIDQTRNLRVNVLRLNIFFYLTKYNFRSYVFRLICSYLPFKVSFSNRLCGLKHMNASIIIVPFS